VSDGYRDIITMYSSCASRVPTIPWVTGDETEVIKCDVLLANGKLFGTSLKV
jgi:hypothetical protein